VTAREAGASSPLVVLVDFDGTIARMDVSDEVMRRHASLDEWAPLEAAYLTGAIGSRTLLTEQAGLLRGETERIATTADDAELDPTFRPFVDDLLARGATVEVVSDGFGFFVRPALARLGLDDLPVFTARTSFGPDRVAISFPDGHPRCHVCGTCKRERILVHQRAGRYTVFIGDGFSDLYAAAHADLVFAKDHLEVMCAERGWPYRQWATFADVRETVLPLLDTGPPQPRLRPFVCGPEVWPVGTSEPRWDHSTIAPPTAPVGEPGSRAKVWSEASPEIPPG
jgi:2-hydroxy-3-keto-5-methylthiopentenyl-1-phosphate phosphatase